jgi:hypothetical protein
VSLCVLNGETYFNNPIVLEIMTFEKNSKYIFWPK